MSDKNSEQPKIRMAETPEEQKQWMAQWRLAEKALLEVKREELRALTDEEAQATSDLLLEGVAEFYIPPRQRDFSGLVEQQRIFAKARS